MKMGSPYRIPGRTDKENKPMRNKVWITGIIGATIVLFTGVITLGVVKTPRNPHAKLNPDCQDSSALIVFGANGEGWHWMCNPGAEQTITDFADQKGIKVECKCQ
jgi:hypothetical protein